MTETAERRVSTQAKRPDPGQCVAVVCPDAAIDAAYFAAGLARRLAGTNPADRALASAPSVSLIDGLPGTGGLDVVTDLERAPGARWSALRGATGAIDVERLLRALPRREGVAVLAHDRARDIVADDVKTRVLRGLSELTDWLVATQPPDCSPEETFSAVVLLLRGSVVGLGAAQRYVEQLGGELPVAVLALEMPNATRAIVADSLGQPLVSSAPTRWRLANAAGSEVTAGMWPGARDRVLGKLLDDVVVYLRSHGRSALWA